MFPPKNGESAPLQGKILNGRYYAPENVFSCQADDFGEGKYIAQDVLMEHGACVGFYDLAAHFKKAEVFFFPILAEFKLDKTALRDGFDGMGIGILKSVDDAKGIIILKEEMVDDNMLFVAISIDKMSVLKGPDGKHLPSTRGHLIFQENDKLVLLSNQEITPLGQKHTPKKHIENLRKDLLKFRATFEFGSIPAVSAVKTEVTKP